MESSRVAIVVTLGELCREDLEVQFNTLGICLYQAWEYCYICTVCSILKNYAYTMLTLKPRFSLMMVEFASHLSS